MNISTDVLGSIVPKGRVRQVIYAVYVLAYLAVVLLHGGFGSIGVHDPQWLVATAAMLNELGPYMAVLALANVAVTAPLAPIDFGATSDGTAVVTSLPDVANDETPAVDSDPLPDADTVTNDPSV